ncbi:hypothetical protein OAT62_03185 [Gammaproteobacteria bacterium]|nr:hypothetical protein [Gammaproteobacteria bacterium]|tara:strand:+ start:1698 stop:1907 length:210 start_codon:yes stop_codon:yes gene_type:complete
MKTYQELFNPTDEQELLKELSLGKISSTVLLSRGLNQIKQLEDKNLQLVLKTIIQMIFITSLQHKKTKR